MLKRVFCDALDNPQYQLEIYPYVYDTADMLLLNYSTPGADCGAAAAAIPIAPSTPEAAVDTCATAPGFCATIWPCIECIWNSRYSRDYAFLFTAERRVGFVRDSDLCDLRACKISWLCVTNTLTRLHASRPKLGYVT